MAEKFRVELEGKPVRFFVASRKRSVETDGGDFTRFGCASDAETKAVLWGLNGYKVVPFDFDGDPTSLTEIGL